MFASVKSVIQSSIDSISQSWSCWAVCSCSAARSAVWRSSCIALEPARLNNSEEKKKKKKKEQNEKQFRKEMKRRKKINMDLSIIIKILQPSISCSSTSSLVMSSCVENDDSLGSKKKWKTPLNLICVNVILVSGFSWVLLLWRFGH